jgi:hypothetical protein
MRRITWIVMLLAVVAISAAPAAASHGRGHRPGRGHGHIHKPIYRHGHHVRRYGRYVPSYRQLWLHSSPSYYHAPYTRLYRPGCYPPRYGGHIGYRGSSFGFHFRF